MQNMTGTDIRMPVQADRQNLNTKHATEANPDPAHIQDLDLEAATAQVFYSVSLSVMT